MTFPKATFTFKNNGIGVGAGSLASGVIAVTGPCTLGTPNTVTTFDAQSAAQVKAALGLGPLATAVAGIMGTPNHRTVLAIPSTIGTAGSFSSVTEVGSGNPDVTMSGTPNDQYAFHIKVSKAGTEASAQVIWSIDTISWSAPVGVASAVTLGETGAIATFASGTYSLGMAWLVDSVAPISSASNLSSAYDALLLSGRDFSWLHALSSPVGASDSARATDAAAVAAALITKCSDGIASNRFHRASFEGGSPVATDSSGISSWKTAMTSSTISAVQTDLVAGCAGNCLVQSPLVNSVVKKNIGFNFVRRLSSCALSDDLGDYNAGAFSDVLSLEYDAGADTSLDAARWVTMRKLDGAHFLTQAPMLSSASSDINLVQHGRVLDEVARVARTIFISLLNSKVKVDATTGRILEREAQRIEADATSRLQSAVGKDISAIRCTISRVDDILRTKNVSVNIEVVPFGYVKAVDVTLGFVGIIATK